MASHTYIHADKWTDFSLIDGVNYLKTEHKRPMKEKDFEGQ